MTNILYIKNLERDKKYVLYNGVTIEYVLIGQQFVRVQNSNIYSLVYYKEINVYNYKAEELISEQEHYVGLLNDRS